MRLGDFTDRTKRLRISLMFSRETLPNLYVLYSMQGDMDQVLEKKQDTECEMPREEDKPKVTEVNKDYIVWF